MGIKEEKRQIQSSFQRLRFDKRRQGGRIENI